MALPLNARGHQYQWFTRGLIDGHVYLSGIDPDNRPSSNASDDMITVADTTTGVLRWLCAPPGRVLSAPIQSCLREPDGPTPAIVSVGRRWMLVLLGAEPKLTVLRYSATGATFKQRLLTASEKRRFKRDVPVRLRNSPLDLDGTRVTLDRRWGYRRTISGISRGTFGKPGYREGNRVVLGRLRDRRLASITLFPARSTGDVVFFGTEIGFGARGMCATTGTQVVLWDKITRRVWRRRIPQGLRGDPFIACPGRSIVLANSSAFNAPSAPETNSAVGPVFAWPTKKAAAGWRLVRRLDPGAKLTISR